MGDDTMAILSLYEASFLMTDGESILEKARDFAIKCLEEYMKKNKLDQNDNLSLLVSHALELHWRMLRLKTQWFIDVYDRKKVMNSSLLELAKLDFNIVQSTHQEDLKYVSKLMENFLWTVGVVFEPQFLMEIDGVIGDVGTLDELEFFTDAVERWNMNARDQLPDYMKMCFLAPYC
ncbi:hypothetical protein TIFTF001_023201 [Ficus carica]|uniref:Uncharacterized protein n=1 Tax=Ficus carica TaxID=3494 RepID=A0AA88AUD9_FICCA|nr:hypothetical protein TIFTF001_023201 [Ficus carica]